MAKRIKRQHSYYERTQIWMEKKRQEHPDFDTVIRPKLGILANNISESHSLWDRQCEDILEHLYRQVTK